MKITVITEDYENTVVLDVLESDLVRKSGRQVVVLFLALCLSCTDLHLLSFQVSSLKTRIEHQVRIVPKYIPATLLY